jgi:hypothetical protein
LGAIAGMFGVSVGVASLMGRQQQITRERLQMKALTGGTAITGQGSMMGFETEERRKRATDIARAVGRDMGPAELTSLVDLGERATRAYGVEGSEQAAFMKASRRAGGNKPDKAFSNAIGVAVAAGMEGSRVSEFLQSMTGSLDQMAEGATIDQASLMGFAGALSTMPFFQMDPRRTAQAIESLQQAFANGDRFQQAMFTRSMMRAGGGTDPASLEVRRMLPLFFSPGESNRLKKGQAGPEKLNLADRIKNLEGGGQLAQALNVSGTDIIKAAFDESMAATSQYGLGRQAFEFMDRMGMRNQAGLEIFTDLRAGKALTPEQIQKFEQAQMTPEERLEKTFSGFDKNMQNLTQSISELKDILAGRVTVAMEKLATAMGNFSTQMGFDPMTSAADISTGAIVAGGAATAAALFPGAAKKVGGVVKKSVTGTGKNIARTGRAAFGGAKGGRGVGRVTGAGKGAGKALTKGLVKGGAKGAKLIPVVGNLISAGLAVGDAYVLAEKMINGEEIFWHDWAELGLDVAGIFDPTRLTAAGAIGLEGYKMMKDQAESQGFSVEGVSMDPGAFGGGPPIMDSGTSEKLRDVTGMPGPTLASGHQASVAGGGAAPATGDRGGALSSNTTALNRLTTTLVRGRARQVFPRGGGVNPTTGVE